MKEEIIRIADLLHYNRISVEHARRELLLVLNSDETLKKILFGAVKGNK